jgi:hypothetical protein
MFHVFMSMGAAILENMTQQKWSLTFHPNCSKLKSFSPKNTGLHDGLSYYLKLLYISMVKIMSHHGKLSTIIPWQCSVLSASHAAAPSLVGMTSR